MRYPVASPQVRAPFGLGPWPVTGYHTGADYVAPTGTPLYPIKDGVVSWVQTGHPTMGNIVEIDIGGGLFTRYLHLSQILVAKGQAVNEGTIVGKAGFSGYVEPPGDAGAHLHAELYTKSGGQPANYMDIHAYIANNGGGTSTMQNISDDSARQIAYHYLGRNGFDGKPNALGGAGAHGDLIGRPLTNAELANIFLSAESREWRDARLPAVYAERDRLRQENAQLKQKAAADATTIANLTKQLAEANARIVALEKQLIATEDELVKVKSENTELQLQVQTLTDDLKAANDEIKDLEAQLAANDCPDITINFNFFGQLLWALLKLFGTNKKG